MSAADTGSRSGTVQMIPWSRLPQPADAIAAPRFPPSSAAFMDFATEVRSIATAACYLMLTEADPEVRQRLLDGARFLAMPPNVTTVFRFPAGQTWRRYRTRFPA